MIQYICCIFLPLFKHRTTDVFLTTHLCAVSFRIIEPNVAISNAKNKESTMTNPVHWCVVCFPYKNLLPFIFNLGILDANSRYLVSVITQVMRTISKGYLDLGVKLDVKAIGMISLY